MHRSRARPRPARLRPCPCPRPCLRQCPLPSPPPGHVHRGQPRPGSRSRCDPVCRWAPRSAASRSTLRARGRAFWSPRRRVRHRQLATLLHSHQARPRYRTPQHDPRRVSRPRRLRPRWSSRACSRRPSRVRNHQQRPLPHRRLPGRYRFFRHWVACQNRPRPRSRTQVVTISIARTRWESRFRGLRLLPPNRQLPARPMWPASLRRPARCRPRRH